MITVSLIDPADEPPPREPMWLRRRLVLAGAALLALVLVLAALAFVQQQRAALLADALARNELFAQVLEDQANRTIDTAELGLSTTAQALRALPHRNDPAELAAPLRRTTDALPFLRSISLVDAQGRLLASSDPANLGSDIPRHQLLALIAVPGLGSLMPGRDLGQLPVGALPPANPPSGPAVVPTPAQMPVQMPAQAAYHLPLVRPVATDGATEWLVASLRPEHFGAQYASLLGSGPQRAALLTLSAQLVAASPGPGLALGQRASAHKVFRDFLPGRSKGQFQGPGLDGAPAYVSFRTARLQPLVMLVETPEAAVTALVDALALRVAGVVGVLLLLVGALAAVVWRSQQTREAVSGDLAAARDSIAAHDAFTDRLFQVSPIPMVVKDTHGRFLRVNRAWTDLTGLSYERVIGFSLGRLYPAQLAAPHMVQEQMAIASGHPVNYEEQILDSDGLPRDVMIRVMPYTDAEGQVSGVITCLTDVTEFREAAQRTLEAKDAAEHANFAKSEFLANISHELRTPLQGILGFSELGTQRGGGDPRLQGMFQDIHGAGQRMLTLVNNLLDLSRLESTVGEIHLAPMDIVPALQAVVQELRPMASKNGLRLSVHGDGVVDHSAAPDSPQASRASALWAAADEFRLQQVLRNVLANAIRFAPRGSAIEIAWGQVSGRDLMISVRDHGPGVPVAELERIFESFVQSSRTRDGSGGTGLGLAICRKIVSAHKGRVSAHNHADGGAVFEIVLPVLTRMPGVAHVRPTASPTAR